jgi:hypothetical protein
MAATDVWMDENEWYHGAYVDKPGDSREFGGILSLYPEYL